MTCMQCGKTINEGQKYCTSCGSQVRAAAETRVRSKGKTIFIHTVVFLALSILLSAAGPLVYCFWNGIPQRVNFDMELRAYEIEAFMDEVSKHIDKSKFEIESVDPGSWGSHEGKSCIRTCVTVKPNGKKPAEIELVFVGEYHYGVSGVYLYYLQEDSQEEILCKNAVIEALEKAIGGETHASMVTNQFCEIGASLPKYESTMMKRYSLADNIRVEISCEKTYEDEWLGKYYLTNSNKHPYR